MTTREQLIINRALLIVHAVSCPVGDWVSDPQAFESIDEAVDAIDRALAGG